MRATITTVLAVVSVCATTVHGQDSCSELLRLSRTISWTVMDRSQFRETVNSFCDERARARTENRSLDLDLRVLGLGEGGGSSASANSLATKYCSDDRNTRRNELNYMQYLEGIEPGAYKAYQACETARREGVEFEMLTRPTRDLLELIVFNRTNIGATAAMSWSASDPVSCRWEAYRGDGTVEGSKRRRLVPDERTRLRCRRDSFNTDPIREPDFVNVIRDGGDATVNIPWRKYGPDNSPVQTVEEIQRQLERQVSDLKGQLDNMASDLGSRVETVNGRFGKLEFQLENRKHGCGVSAPACQEGWIDTSVVFHNTFPGGGCGQGTVYRLCVRVGE